MDGGDLLMSRFFSDIIEDDIITLSEEDSKHLAKVLRVRMGEEIEVCDGKGMEYLAEVSEISPKCVKARIIKKEVSSQEPKVKVTVFQGLPKGSKMELIIQKCVVIGVADIVPVATSRAVVKLDEEKAGGKVDRWNKISLEAAKQSSRAVVPKIHTPVSFDDAIKKASEYDLKIIPYEKHDETGFKTFLSENTPETVAVFIGPEGGFEEAEIEKAISLGIKPVSLGKRILRTETAPLTVLSVLMYEYDW